MLSRLVAEQACKMNMFRPFTRSISTSVPLCKVNRKQRAKKTPPQPTKGFPAHGGHPEGSRHLKWTDWQPIHIHPRDFKLAANVQVPTAITAQPPRLDKLYKTIELECLGYESAILDSYEWFVVTAATHLGITVGKRWSPQFSDKYRFNLLRSVHIFKKHQVHYEVRTYHRFINIHKLTGSTADTFLEYIERNLPEGMGLKVTKFEVLPVPDYLETAAVNTTIAS